jgi:hypothetical protein
MLEPLPGAAIGVIGVTTAALLAPWVLFSPEEIAQPGFNARRRLLLHALPVRERHRACDGDVARDARRRLDRTGPRHVGVRDDARADPRHHGNPDPVRDGPSPVYYGSGYIASRDYWRLGLVFGAIFLVALLAFGLPYNTMLK